MIKLSICIATLNRAPFLGETLDAFLDDLPESAEVVIVDGASTDATPAVVAERAERCPRLRYVRLDQKGGVDQDYCRTVEAAQGEFCWLMTDDDVLRPGAIATVLERLDDAVDLLVVNAEVRDAELQTVREERKLRIVDDRRFGPDRMDDLFVCAADLLSFIGSVVIRRAVWQERAREPYFGTEFVHVGVIFQRPLERDALVLADPLILIRYGNAHWTPRAFGIWMFKWPRLLWSLEGVSSAAKAQVIRRDPWNDPGTLLRFKARGDYSRAEYRQLADVSFTPLTHLAAWAIAAFPDRLFNRLLWRAAPLVAKRPALLRQDLDLSRFGRGRRDG